jgi:hypothetical protein
VAVRCRVDLVAGLLGALAAMGLLLVVTLGVTLLAVLVGTTQRGAGAIGSALTDASLTTSALLAGLLAVMVLLPFVVGGYVGARLSSAHAPGQAVVVWAWALLPMLLVGLGALFSGGSARHGVALVLADPAGALLVLSGLSLSLLGSLLGADTARRHRAAPTAP